jgi:hypothetical protein
MFIPRACLQFRKPEPRIRRLSWRQLLDVSVMQELAIMRRLTTAVLLVAASDPALFRLPYSFTHPYRGTICFELFRTDFITLPGEMKYLESR